MRAFQALIAIGLAAVSAAQTPVKHRDPASAPEPTIPVDLAGAHRELDLMLPASVIRKLRDAKSEDAVTDLHFSVGLWIRNHWGLWRHSRLCAAMARMGFRHPDVMSSAILGTYWCRLHGLPQRVEERAEQSRNYWRQVAVPSPARCALDGSPVHWDEDRGQPGGLVWLFGHCESRHHWWGYQVDHGWKLVGPKAGKPPACSPRSSTR